MKVERILRQIGLLLSLLLMLDTEGILRLAEGKSFQKVDHLKDGASPTVSIKPFQKTVKEGKRLALVCTATGKPKPRIKWKKNGRTISSGYRIKIRVTDAGSKLRIRDSIPQDSGIYHCVAKNPHGYNRSAEAMVKVNGKQKPINGTCKPYSGIICSSYISEDVRVFVPHIKSQEQSEENIVFAASLLQDYMKPTCKKSLLKALCYDLFPPCQSGKHARPRQLLCKDECEVLQASTCSKEFRLLRERLGSLVEETVPNCSKLKFDCLGMENNTIHRRDICQKFTGASEVIIKPLKGNYPMCNQRFSKRVKIYNKEIFQLVKNVNMELQNGGMTLTSKSNERSTYCFSALLLLGNLVREWNTFYTTPPLPNFQRPQNLTVPGLKISTRNSSVDSIWIPLGYSPNYRVHEKVSLRNVTFYYRYQSGHGSFIAEGEYDLCETVFKLTVETLRDGTVKLSGFSETPLDVSTIETAFVSARPSNRLVDAIKKTNLFVLRLMKPVMEAYINNDLIVKFSGDSYMYFGPSTLPVTLEFFGGKLHGHDVLLAGITSTHITTNQALKLFTGLTIPNLAILKHSPNGTSVGITLSAHALDLNKTPYGTFQQQPLSLAFADNVPWGLSLVTRASIAEETHNSSQAQLFQTIFGRGSEFTLKASTNWKDITLNWYFHNLSKGAATSFDGLQMKMKINDTSSSSPLLHTTASPFMEISVDGTFYKSKQRSESLPFSGQLTYEGRMSYLEGNFGTQSVWRKAFGIEYLTMKNLRLGLSLPTDQSQKSSIRGEADLELGSVCNATRNGENDSIKQNCVTGHLYLGFSEESADHFFYGTLSPVSLQKLLEVCNIDHKLPGALATIGFPEGLQISVARGAHDLRAHGGPNLKPGFILAGKMSVLGIETTGAISLLPREFLIDAKIMSDEAPATIDDVTPLFMSSSDPDHTPKLFLKARMDPDPFVKAHIDSYARLFGIFKEVRMLVTSDSLQIYLTTDVNKSFKINVQMTTNYSSDRNETQFNATVVFHNGLTKLTRLASRQVVAMLESEMSNHKSAKGEVQRLRRECVKTIKRECASCMSDGVCASSLSSKTSKTSTNTSERKRDTKRTSSTMDICQHLVMDRCLATETAHHNVCRFISSKLNKTCTAYEAAAKLERGLRWVKQAEQFMYSDLFQIHAISFKTNVTSSKLDQIYMDTALEVTIFGKKQRLDGLRMNFNEFVKLSSEIAKYAVDWYQKTQPQSKLKSRHPDNRPRPPAS